MIAHGTGIVPFVSILERIANLLHNSASSDAFGEFHLFYGCRNDLDEFLYKGFILSTLETLNSLGCKVSLHLACSRAQSDIPYPSYVSTTMGYV
jgi:sulfite reductase alpha subunit-like flavoprotein